MPQKRHSAEEIVAKLRQADVLRLPLRPLRVRRPHSLLSLQFEDQLSLAVVLAATTSACLTSAAASSFAPPEFSANPN